MNNTIDDNLTISVPKPLDNWYGDKKIDQDNQDLLKIKPRELMRLKTGFFLGFFGADELKNMQTKINELNQSLADKNVEQYLDEYKKLADELEDCKVALYNLKNRHARTKNEEKKAKIIRQAKIEQDNAISIKADRKRLNAYLKPFKRVIRERDKLQARVDEHYASIYDEEQSKKDLVGMDKEARMIAELIIIRLAKLNFRHRVTKRDMFGKMQEKNQLVKFERIVCTPDKVYLKVDVSSLGLLGGHIDHLPNDVYAQDICTEKVLKELSISLGRPVNSPNRSQDAEWHQGVWYEVDRLGLTDGLQDKVTWKQVMQRYPEDQRDLMPVPMGVMKGRKINWIYLTKEPHLMINGVTGFGKSNCIQMFISTLVSKHSANDVRFIIVDLKNNGDFGFFERLPHMLGTAIDAEPALDLIERTFKEMKRRQSVIKNITNDISLYNKIVDDEDKLPHVFFIIDEYPALTVKPKIHKEINLFASQIAMQGRSVGIHMLVSGQQSYGSDMPRRLSANVTAKFTARQSTASGAMATTGNMETTRMKNIKGRFMCITDADHYQVQMPFIDIEQGDIDNAVRDAMKWDAPRPFELPELDREKPENVATMPTMTDEEIVLKTAFEQFEGQLKLRDIWEINKIQLSQGRTKKAIKRIVDRGEIEYENMLYEPIKSIGGSYQLIEIEDISNSA